LLLRTHNGGFRSWRNAFVSGLDPYIQLMAFS
jgi:hypothetical protein